MKYVYTRTDVHDFCRKYKFAYHDRCDSPGSKLANSFSNPGNMQGRIIEVRHCKEVIVLYLYKHLST